MKKIAIYILLLQICSSYSQPTNWHCFVESKGALKMTTMGSDIWISTNAGLVQFNKISHAYSLLDKNNSPLPSNFISAITNDGNGKLWVAVNNKTTFFDLGSSFGISSLLKFNGSSWVEYNQSNSPLPQAQIIDLEIDMLGNIWFVTSAGQLVKYDNTSWVIYDSTNSPLLNNIYCFTIDPMNNLWIGTFNGVYKFDGITWINYNTTNSPLLSNVVFSIQSDDFGKIWMGSVNSLSGTGGLNSFDGTTWNSYVAGSSGLPVDWVNQLSTDHASVLWLNADASGLTKFDGTTWQTFNTSNSGIISDRCTAILSDSGVTWYGSGFGLSKFDGTTWQNFDFNQVNMSSNRIYSLEIDGLNNKYMPTDLGAGLIKYDNVSWTIDSSYYGHSSWFVESDTNEHLWASVEGIGVKEYDGTSWYTYSTTNSSLPSDYIQTIFCDKQNNKWMGGYSAAGLIKYDGTTWSIYNITNSAILSNSVNSICQDSSGKIWIAHPPYWNGSVYSVGGVCSFDGATFISYDTSNSGILSNHVTKVLCDQANNVWVATLAGLSKFDGSTWSNYPTSAWGLDTCMISSLVMDINNILWIGTDSGLVSYDGVAWNIYSEQNSGLPMNYISDIQADIYGNKWIAFGQPHPVGSYSGYGITVFNENGIFGIQGVNGIHEQIVREADCKVFPNPFTESTTIEIKNKNHFDYCDLQLFDTDGKIVLSSRFREHSFEINRGQLKSGIYFYSIISNEGKLLGKGKCVVIN